MEIVHEEAGAGRGRFHVGEGTEQAELTYSPAGQGDALVFDHTFVPPSLRGRGLAEALVERAVAHARDTGRKVVPACSYVRALFERHPERYADLRVEAAPRG
ncbi:MAG: GNAT family N-acetyltransferase [Methylobacterium sp.]